MAIFRHLLSLRDFLHSAFNMSYNDVFTDCDYVIAINIQVHVVIVSTGVEHLSVGLEYKSR